MLQNQEMCDKAVENYSHALEFVPECDKTKKCVIKLLILILLQYNLFSNAIRLKKCVIEQFMDAFLYLFDSIPDKYKTQEIYNNSLYFPFIVY